MLINTQNFYTEKTNQYFQDTITYIEFELISKFYIVYR